MEENKKKFPVVTVIVIVIGFILFLSGLILYLVSGDKYRLTRGEVEVVEKNFDAEEVEKLNFDLSVGKFTIKTGDTGKIEVVGQNVPKDGFDIGTEGNTFIVKAKEKEWYKNINIPFGGKVEGMVFEIIVPDKKYNTIDLDCGVGEIIIDGLDAENFKLDGGVGTVDMTDCNIGKTVIDAGIGEINFQGKLLGDTDIDMGIGAVNFDIDGYENDYDIKSDGNVSINSGKNSSENDKKYKIVVDDGIGKIKFNFK